MLENSQGLGRPKPGAWKLHLGLPSRWQEPWLIMCCPPRMCIHRKLEYLGSGVELGQKHRHSEQDVGTPRSMLTTTPNTHCTWLFLWLRTMPVGLHSWAMFNFCKHIYLAMKLTPWEAYRNWHIRRNTSTSANSSSLDVEAWQKQGTDEWGGSRPQEWVSGWWSLSQDTLNHAIATRGIRVWCWKQ